jgi:peptidoglycan hydrolase-like protein with peptidoglycan-binding domain
MRLVSALVALMLVLSGCGTSTSDRAISGAGIGAAAGVVIGAVTGLTVLQGVVLGAASGGLIGGFTKASTVNLGDPIWASGDRQANASAVSRVQAGLNRLGYESGTPDGVLGPRTKTSIEAYERDHGLAVDGKPTLDLAQHIDQQLQPAQKG